jgi:site-specific recombinase XerD
VLQNEEFTMAHDTQLRQKSDIQLRVLSRPSTPLDLALDIFTTAKEAERCTPRTIENYRFTLARFRDWLAARGVQDPREIISHHIRLFLAELDKQGLSAGYIHIHARVIKTWVRFLHAEEIIASDPMHKVTMPRLDKTILPAFSTDDVKRLLDACENERDRALVLCLLDSGCRAAEFVALTIADVDTKRGTVSVRQGKGRKDRVAFLGAKARKALLKYLLTRPDAEPAEPLFPSVRTGERLKPNGLLLLCRRLGSRAGVEHCHPHTFRRTFALWSLRAGMNIYALQQIMGHSDLEVLRKYLALVEEDLEDAHRKHGAVDNML